MAKKKRSASTKRAAASASKNNKKKNTNDYLIYHIAGSAFAALFLGIFLYTGGDAIVSAFVRNSLCGLFGISAYLIPLSLAADSAYLFYEKNVSKFWKKFVFSALALCNLAALVHLATASDFSSVASSVGSGGFIGAFISILLVKLIQKIAACILLIITMLVLIGAISGVSTLKTLASYIKSGVMYLKRTYEDFRDREPYEDDVEFKEYEDIPVEKKRPRRQRRQVGDSEKNAHIDPNMEAANSFAADAGKRGDTADMDLPDLTDGIEGIFNKRKTEPEEEPEPVFDIPIGDDSRTEAAEVIPEPREREKKQEKNITAEEKTRFNREFDDAVNREEAPYVYPTLDLLNKTADASKDLRSEMRSTSEKLISVLASFGVKARLLQVTQGPSVTRYEIQPETGTKLSKIEGLSKDIALNLAVSNVLVAPVPGKAAVGIEIPNKKVNTVGLYELLSSKEFKTAKSKLTFALGKDIGGNVVIGDIAKMPHMLIAGATGSGKSVCINTMILSILYNASPREVKLIMVDPKRVELGVYNGIPHLLVPVVTDPKKAAGALNWAVAEMMRRYDLLNETNTRKLESYNKLMRSTGGEELPQLVIIIDELADLMMVAAKEVENYICRIAQLARAAGIHLIVATQRPSVDVITGLIKANIPSRIALSVSSAVDSKTILDHGGAEKLLGKGDMLYHPAGARDARRVQGAFVDDPERDRVLNFIKEHSEITSYSEDLEDEIERCATGENGVTPDVEEDGDSLLPEAVNLAMELGKISTSMIQRRLGVGYSRAGRIVDQMEKRGIISGPNGSKPREVLVSGAAMNSGGYDGDGDDE